MNGVNGDHVLLNGTNGSSTVPTYIYPPPDLRGKSYCVQQGLVLNTLEIVDKTASWVARKGPQFEDRIREKEEGNPKFSFLNVGDAYYPYYHKKLQDIISGKDDASTPTRQTAAAHPAQPAKPAAPKEPEQFEFILDLPPMSAQDLDVIKMTAQFVANNGQRFMDDLVRREGGNYQFDFLRPNHSLNRLFNTLVEQYSKVFLPPQDLRNRLLSNSKDKFGVLERVKSRAEYEAYLQSEKQKQDDAEEQERVAYNSIDWHDFVVVETVEITEADEQIQLPPPTSLEELQSMSLAQKRRADIIGEEPIEDGAESMDTDAPVVEESSTIAPPPSISSTPRPVDPSIKIKTDYVPKSMRPRQVETKVCPICSQRIPVDQMNEHVRVELKDPRYKEQRRIYEERISSTNLLEEGGDVASNIRNLARSRTDLFGTDEATQRRRQREEEERARARERESNVWDGHTATKDLTSARMNTPAEEQAAMKRREAERVAAIGPQVRSAQPYPPQGFPGYPPYGAPPPTGPPTHQGGGRPAPGPPGPPGPPSKRARTDMPNGQLYPEASWAQLYPHPITIRIQVPILENEALITKYPQVAEIGGDLVDVPDLRMNTLISTLKDRVSQRLGVPAGKQILSFRNQPTKNAANLAQLNAADRDIFVLGVRK